MLAPLRPGARWPSLSAGSAACCTCWCRPGSRRALWTRWRSGRPCTACPDETTPAPADARRTSHVLDPPPDRIRYDPVQSEEGGRFFDAENRYLIVEVGRGLPDRRAGPDFCWVTAGAAQRAAAAQPLRQRRGPHPLLAVPGRDWGDRADRRVPRRRPRLRGHRLAADAARDHRGAADTARRGGRPRRGEHAGSPTASAANRSRGTSGCSAAPTSTPCTSRCPPACTRGGPARRCAPDCTSWWRSRWRPAAEAAALLAPPERPACADGEPHVPPPRPARGGPAARRGGRDRRTPFLHGSFGIPAVHRRHPSPPTSAGARCSTSACTRCARRGCCSAGTRPGAARTC